MKHPKPGVDYNPSSEESIVYYAMNLEGSTLRKELDIPADIELKKKGKGRFGESVEYYYFGYEPNSKQAPDFAEVGIELKVTPLKIVRGDQLIPKERLVITMISYMDVIKETFEDSLLYHKIDRVLLMHYLNDGKVDPFDYEFKLIHLWSLPKEDYPTVKSDWETIVGKIKSGLAHELSGSDTNYLEACTKGANSTRMRQQPFSETLAKPRAFALKASYVRTIVEAALDAQPILRDAGEEGLDLERLIQAKIKRYIGMSDTQLCARFGVDYELKPEARWAKLTYCMLGISSNKSSEFIKANISVRSIREEVDGRVVESMSLAPFEFLSLANETWEESELFTYFEETRFFFVVYKSDGKSYNLKRFAFWNMPAKLLNSDVRKGWENIKNAITRGVKFVERSGANGRCYYENNLPKKCDNQVIHLRPHAKKAAYRFLDGREIGNIKSHASELPDGQWMTKQSFWLNNSFIRDLITKFEISE